MSEPVRWGVLSTARINQKVLDGAAGSDDLTVMAVASRSQAAAETYALEHAIERAHGSYDALLADGDVEAVYISLPNALHVEWSIRALQAGKHVLCEKPLSRHASEVERAFDVAERSDRLLMEAFMYRHNPQIKRLKTLVADGAIGRLRAVHASFGFHIGDAGDVRLSRELEGGSLLDVGCYCVSAARLLCGEPERVQAEQVIGGDGVDVAFAGVLRFPGEVLAHFDCGFVLDKTEELVVLGEEGNLRLADPWHCRAPGIELRRDGKAELIAVEAANSYRLQLENLSAAIRGCETPLLGRADALGQARAIEALYASAEEHRAVGL
ncbi:MAG: Gfo/Idh/MocA family oxidoreductase [Solirubrobacteraceae bacterium]